MDKIRDVISSLGTPRCTEFWSKVVDWNQMEPNPYQAPMTRAELKVRAPSIVNQSSRDLLRDWEYRRLWFNAILAAVTLSVGVLLNFLILECRFWQFAVEGAIVASICFCVGPVGTWYLSRLGFDHRVVGTVLFWVGTAIAIMLTASSLILSFVPWQD